MRNASGHNYRNSSFILDVAVGQMPRSTERISCLLYQLFSQNFSTNILVEQFFHLLRRLTSASSDANVRRKTSSAKASRLSSAECGYKFPRRDHFMETVMVRENRQAVCAVKTNIKSRLYHCRCRSCDCYDTVLKSIEKYIYIYIFIRHDGSTDTLKTYMQTNIVPVTRF